jgi:hypothetical protein
MSDYWWIEKNPEDILNKEETINKLSSKALKKIANKYLKDKYRLEIVLMPEK